MTKLKQKTIKVYEKPEGFEDSLGDYGGAAYDSYCGEPVSWGFKILHHLGEEKWSRLGKFGKLDCIGFPGTWYLVVDELTPERAIKKYGKVTDLELGPRGGFKSVTYGEKKFLSRMLNPNKYD